MASSGSGTSSGGSNNNGGVGGGGAGTPCGACKFLRRKCAADCIFAPYFCSDQGPARFAAIHKVFGASNVSKLLLHVPVADRCDAVVTIAYEAQARLRDPVYGCVANVFALQHQVVAYLQAQIMQMKAQLAHNSVILDSPRHTNNNINNNATSPYNPWQEPNNSTAATVPPSAEWGATVNNNPNMNYCYSTFNPPPTTVSPPRSSPESVGTATEDYYYYLMQQIKYREEAPLYSQPARKRPYNNELGCDFQGLADRY
ncbi:LOB domain-containing protein 16 [Linum perenne]